MKAVAYDGEGRFGRLMGFTGPDATTYLEWRMAQAGITDFLVLTEAPDPETTYVSAGMLTPRPELPARTVAVNVPIPHNTGETVTVTNESADVVSSSDPADPVTIVEEGSYVVCVEAAFPAQTLKMEVTLA